MTAISDLSWDLVEEILLRAPITSLGAVRSTCKTWNDLSKDRILFKAEAKHQFLGFMVKNSKLCSLRFDLHGHEEFADPSIKEISNLFNQVEISELLLCDGLLLCVPKDKPCLMVWNPYLGQTRWIKTRTAYHSSDMYALGYDNNKNRNHKLLRYRGAYYKSKSEIYDFKSDSWRVLDDTLHRNVFYQSSASLKGNAYILDMDGAFAGSFYCFDFTTERFGQLLHLPPSPSYFGLVRALFSLREEKLATLSMETQASGVGIWITTKIEPNAVSWSYFLRIDFEAIPRDAFFRASRFFIDEEKKLAVLFRSGYSDRITKPHTLYQRAYISGENEFLKAVDLGEFNKKYGYPALCSSSYVPSLVQIKRNCTKWSLEDYLVRSFYNNMLLVSCITSFSIFVVVLGAMYFNLI